MINKYPIGLWARTSFFKVLKSVWNKEVQDFVISRMLASTSNIKPVIVIDDTTEKAKCYFINEKKNGFNEETGLNQYLPLEFFIPKFKLYGNPIL